ncbi:MAG: hypothetical protein HC854_14375 [Flavobacterium sp.]|nr:hypothetical protein [Flavobacterium sp.]
MDCYIEFLDSKNNFRKTRKEFSSYEIAYNWMIKNIEKSNIDFIKYI